MKPLAALKHHLTKAHRESQAGRYDRALAMLNELLLTWPNHSALLVRRAELLQLQEDQDPKYLKNAKADLHLALELDQDSPAALIELAHFCNAVEDDPRTAAKYFDKAVMVCKELLKEALLGQADAFAELEQRQNAFARLAEAYWIQAHDGKEANGEEILRRLEALRLSERGS